MRKLCMVLLALSFMPLLVASTMARDEFRAELVRVADLPQDLRDDLAPTGDDPLDRGQVRAEEGRIRVEVRGAVPNAEYRLMFCEFGPAPRNCGGIGNVTTDERGRGEARFSFDGIDLSSGLFAIKRPATAGELTPIQFVAISEPEKED